MALVRVDWNPTDRKVRQFGGLLALFSLILAGLAWRKGNVHGAMTTAIIGTLLGAASACVPALGRRIYQGWMAVAFVIGTIISSVLLFFLYYFVVTPLGLFFRCLGRDALGLRGDKDSYWVPLNIPDDNDYFERLH